MYKYESLHYGYSNVLELPNRDYLALRTNKATGETKDMRLSREQFLNITKNAE